MDVRPNLFIVGAQRSGTTSLWTYLRQHPDVFAPRKEIMFFVSKNQDVNKYLNLFRAGGRHKYRVDASPHYAFEPRHPCPANEIKKFNPDATILYTVRHPTARTISHWALEASRGNENLSLSEAVSKKEIYTSVSNYASQLQPYLDTFGPGRVTITVLEDMISSPKETMSWLHARLGLREFKHGIHGAKFNKAESKLAMSKLNDDAVRDLSRFLSERQEREVREFERLIGRKTGWKFPFDLNREPRRTRPA